MQKWARESRHEGIAGQEGFYEELSKCFKIPFDLLINNSCAIVDQDLSSYEGSKIIVQTEHKELVPTLSHVVLRGLEYSLLKLR